MTRGRTRQGRSRAARALLDVPKAKPLLEAFDHGPEIRLEPSVVAASGDRWIEPFLAANGDFLRRLRVTTTVDPGGHVLRLSPGPRIGAIPLLSPATRRVAAGLLIKPRFRWSALGAVLSGVGFAIEPSLGGTPLVPGSAREVPPWILAAPVLRRLEAYLRHRKRGFGVRREDRESPRGRVDWARWARSYVPSGRWTNLPCEFSEPDDDPELMAALRWTLSRLDDDLSLMQDAIPARLLKERIADLLAIIGPGLSRRPIDAGASHTNDWIAEAVEAMGWVADERGLGGSRVLDGMSWDLPVDQLWESWVDTFVANLAPRCGLTAVRRGATTRTLNWTSTTASMRLLIPDSGLRGDGRFVWVDAKYKAHLQMLAHRGWSGLDEATSEAHRADIHQALAYAALDDGDRIDSMLVYPELSGSEASRPAVATLACGRRRVRLILIGLPFGFRSPEQREAKLTQWRELLSA